MTTNQKIRRINQLRAEGLSFRDIEKRLARTLRVGTVMNGTKAFRLFKRGLQNVNREFGIC